MPDYQKLYLTLFNTLTDAIVYLDAGNIWSARQLLMEAQLRAEEQYISQECSPLVLPDQRLPSKNSTAE